MPYYDDEEDALIPPILGEDSYPVDYDGKLAEYRAKLKEGDEWRSHLSSDWLSPRMRALIQATAEINGEDPYIHEDSSCVPPSYVMSRIQCSRGTFLCAWQHVLMKIGETFGCRKNPNVEQICQKIMGHYEEWEYRGPAKAYFDNGGRIEHALDAVLKMAAVRLGDEGWDEILEFRQKPLVKTPFDEDFDLVRIMCFDRTCFETHGRNVCRGVTHHGRAAAGVNFFEEEEEEAWVNRYDGDY